MGSLKSVLKNDERYKTFKRIVENSKVLQLDDLYKEIETLHSSRNSRLIRDDNSIGAKKLIDANARDQAYRSRLAEIMVVVMKQQGPLLLAYDTMQDYASTHYGNYFPVRSKADRAAYLRSGPLNTAYKRLEKMNLVISACKIIIEDIDKTAWALKSMMEGLAIVSKGEVQL